MKNMMVVGGVTALVTGIFIGIQSLLSGKAGNIIGPINTGFWTNFLGGSLAGLIILGITLIKGFDVVKITRPALWITLASGLLGIMIIMGISFSISRAGVAAGLSAVIFGQLLFGALSDTYGWGGVEPIPLDIKRVIGLLIMAVGVLILLSKK
jgi:transporter family-2 protein